MNDPRLSIVTPSYNQEEFLRDNLESVMNQLGDNYEHIVVDGGSTDGTISVLEEYESRYNLRWISEDDDGQSDAINKGIDMARGEWIGWQNSDDFYCENSFSAFFEGLRDNPNADCIYGDMIVVDSDGEPLHIKYHHSPSSFIERNWRHFLSNQSMFVKKSTMNDIGNLSKEYEYTMDSHLIWKLIDYGAKFVFIDEIIGALREQPNAKTSGSLDERQTHIEEREKINSLYKRSPIEEFCPRKSLTAISIVYSLYLFYKDERVNKLPNYICGMIKRNLPLRSLSVLYNSLFGSRLLVE